MGAAELAGRRVLVTGAAQGIGAEIAVEVAARGATVALLDRDPLGLAETASRLATDGRRPVEVVADLRDAARVRGAAQQAIAALGGLDALVNNAGVFEKVALADITVEQWDRMLAINTRGPLLLMQGALEALRRSSCGRIVNVTSMGAKLAAPLEAHYAASKAALLALTRAAAVEWGGFGITVNAVSPGYVLTDMGADSRSPEEVAAWTARSPLGRLGRPGDVAAAVAFLLSDAAAYLTGQVLDVTGGMVMS